MLHTIDLYECPKCRTLRFEKAYFKQGKFFSTCEFCREHLTHEDDYVNFNIQKVAILDEKPYTSRNKIPTKPLDNHFTKIQLINALISRLNRQYATLPSTIEVNAYYLLIISHLCKLQTYNKTLGEIQNLLRKKPDFSKLKDFHSNTVIDVRLHRSFDKEYLIGEETEILTYQYFEIPIAPEKTIKDVRKRYEHRRRRYLNQMWNQQEHICYMCGVELSKSSAIIDHKLPIVRGGKNNLDNLALCCDFCNNLKDCRTHKEMSEYIKPFKQLQDKHDFLSNKNHFYALKLVDFAKNGEDDYSERMQNVILGAYTKNLEKIDAISEYTDLLKKKADLERLLN